MRKLLAVLALGALAACGGDSSTGPSSSISGTYSLKSVNGEVMPAVLGQAGSDKYEITSGSLSITNGTAYTVSLNSRTTVGGQVTTDISADAGTVTVNGTAVTFTSSAQGAGATPITGTYANGNTITLTDQGTSLVFQK
jgi:hypothetical protein